MNKPARYLMANETAIRVGALMRARRDAVEKWAAEVKAINDEVGRLMLQDLALVEVQAPLEGGADMNTLEWVVTG